MNDIIDVYEPIYRETNYLIPILLAIIIAIVLGVSIFLLIKKLKRRTKTESPQKRYERCLDDFLKIDNKSNSHDFSNRVNYIFKNYLTHYLDSDFMALTTNELLGRLEELNIPVYPLLDNLFREKIDPALYGNIDIDSDSREKTVESCVECITYLFNSNSNKDLGEDESV